MMRLIEGPVLNNYELKYITNVFIAQISGRLVLCHAIQLGIIWSISKKLQNNFLNIYSKIKPTLCKTGTQKQL